MIRRIKQMLCVCEVDEQQQLSSPGNELEQRGRPPAARSSAHLRASALLLLLLLLLFCQPRLIPKKVVRLPAAGRGRFLASAPPLLIGTVCCSDAETHGSFTVGFIARGRCNCFCCGVRGVPRAMPGRTRIIGEPSFPFADGGVVAAAAAALCIAPNIRSSGPTGVTGRGVCSFRSLLFLFSPKANLPAVGSTASAPARSPPATSAAAGGRFPSIKSLPESGLQP